MVRVFVSCDHVHQPEMLRQLLVVPILELVWIFPDYLGVQCLLGYILRTDSEICVDWSAFSGVACKTSPRSLACTIFSF